MGPRLSSGAAKFQIDGGTPQTEDIANHHEDPVAEHNVAIFTSSPLPEGQHQLSMQSTGSAVPAFQLDYIIYTTISAPPGSTRFIDDTDPAVQYSSGWGANNASQNMLGTSQLTIQPNAWVALSFDALDGDQFSMRGPVTNTASGQSMQILASVDGGKPTPLPNQVLPLAGQTNFGSALFTTQTLKAGQHSFNFTYVGGPGFAVDYFLIGPNLSQPPLRSADAGPSSIVPPAPSGISDGSNASTSSKAKLAGPPTGVIVGAIVGSFVVVLLLAVGGFLLWRRRRRRKIAREVNSHESAFTPSVTQWAGKSVAYQRDSMATLTDLGSYNPYSAGPAQMMEKPPPPETRPKSGYLYYPDS